MTAQAISAAASCATLIVAVIVALRLTRRQVIGNEASGRKASWDLDQARKPRFAVSTDGDVLVIQNEGPDDYTEVCVTMVDSADAQFYSPIRLLATTAKPSATGMLGSLRASEIKRLPFERIHPGAGGRVLVDFSCKAIDGQAPLTSRSIVDVVGPPMPKAPTASELAGLLLPTLQSALVSTQIIGNTGLNTSRVTELIDGVARVVEANGNRASAVLAFETHIVAKLASWKGADPGNRVVIWYADGDQLTPGASTNCNDPSALGDDTTRGRALRSLFLNGDDTIYCPDFSSALRQERALAWDGEKWPSFAYVPIRAGGRTLGLIEIACRCPGVLGEHDIQAFEIMAAFLATARICHMS